MSGQLYQWRWDGGNSIQITVPRRSGWGSADRLPCTRFFSLSVVPLFVDLQFNPFRQTPITLQLTLILSDFVYRFLVGPPLLGTRKKVFTGARTCSWLPWTSRPSRYTLGERRWNIHWVESWVVFRDGLDVLEIPISDRLSRSTV